MWKRMLPILISLKVLLFSFNVAFASEAELLRRIEKLEKELTELKTQLAREREKNHRKVQKLEAAVKSNNVRWYGNLRTIGAFVNTAGINSFFQSTDYTKNLKAKRNTERWLTRFRLNGIAKFEDFAFHTRISAYYLWGDRDRIYYFPYDDGGRRPTGGAELFLERAYVDWKLSDFPILLTIGRLPVGEGPPADFRNDSVRKSVYPALYFDGSIDGIILSISLEKFTGIRHSGIRIGYGKLYQSDVDPSFYLQRKDIKDTRGLFLLYESLLPDWVGDDTLSVIGTAYVRDVTDLLDVNGVYTINATTGELIPLNEAKYNIGSVKAFGMHLQAKRFFYSDFDAFLSAGVTMTDPDLSYVKTSKGTRMISLLGSPEEKTGWAFYTGFRYNFDKMNKVGFEFNHGSKYWLTFSQAPEDLMEKLTINGNAYEAYFIHRFAGRIMSRVGFVYLDYDYLMGIPTWAAPPREVDFTVKTIYGLLDFRF